MIRVEFLRVSNVVVPCGNQPELVMKFPTVLRAFPAFGAMMTRRSGGLFQSYSVDMVAFPYVALAPAERGRTQVGSDGYLRRVGRIF